MIITYHGQAFVKVGQGDLTIAFNPISRAVDPKAAKFGADIALLSLSDPVFNGKDNVSFGNKIPFVIDGPGEYEVSGYAIQGFASTGPGGKINTIYTITVDGIRLCHLGGLTQADLDIETVEELGVIDVLFLPVGGGDYLSPKIAAKLAADLEPKLIVPILYNGDDSLKTFLKESGMEKENSVDKLSLKKKDLEGQEGEIAVVRS